MCWNPCKICSETLFWKNKCSSDKLSNTIYQMLNLHVYVNGIVLSFLPLSSILVYHRYANAYIGPYGIWSWHSILTSSNLSNSIMGK